MLLRNELAVQAVDTQVEFNQRLLAIKQLGAVRSFTSVNKLITLFHDDNSEIVAAAIESLSKIGGQESAMAMAGLLVEQDVKDSLCLSALLNGLSIDGYGIIEPHSYTFLLSTICNLNNQYELLELALSALEGVTLSQPPELLLDLIDDKSQVPLGVSKAAISLFKGISDTSFLSNVLNKYLNNRIIEDVRFRLIANIQFIPVDFSQLDIFWQYFTGLQIDFPKDDEFWKNYDHYQQGEYYEFRHVLKLVVRTLKRFPNHPIRRFYLPYLKEVLSDECLVRSPLSESLILSASIVKNDFKVCERLVTIASDNTYDDILRGSAISALKHFNLSNNDCSSLMNLLECYFDNPIENSGVAHALITNFPELSFKYGNRLIQFEDDELVEDLQEIKDLLFNRSQMLGYLFLNNQLIGPLGSVVE